MNRTDIDKILESRPAFMGRRRMIFGVGVNDADFSVYTKIDGKDVFHSAYKAWKEMIRRGFDNKFKLDNPTYSDCTVSNEWTIFSKFKSWWDKNYVDGYYLDKDILSHGNKIYCKELCVYVPIEINNFTIACDARRGEFPVGVSFVKQKGKFVSEVKFNKGRISLGHFNDPIEAHKAWYRKKVELAYGYKDLCDSIHPDLFNGLLLKIESLREF